MCFCSLHLREAVSEGAQCMRREGGAFPKCVGEGEGTRGHSRLQGLAPANNKMTCGGFVGSVGPSEAASFEDCKEKTVLQSL